MWGAGLRSRAACRRWEAWGRVLRGRRVQSGGQSGQGPQGAGRRGACSVGHIWGPAAAGVVRSPSAPRSPAHQPVSHSAARLRSLGEGRRVVCSMGHTWDPAAAGVARSSSAHDIGPQSISPSATLLLASGRCMGGGRRVACSVGHIWDPAAAGVARSPSAPGISPQPILPQPISPSVPQRRRPYDLLSALAMAGGSR